MSFILDANVFIQSERVRYPMDLAPGFWDQILAAARAGALFSIDEVYDELKDYGDGLAGWAQANREALFRPNSDEHTQRAMVAVGDAVQNRTPAYTDPAKVDFFDGADPWLIAFCLAHGHILVTEETGNPHQYTKVRIPDICAILGVQTMPMLPMLRAIRFRLVGP